MVEQGGGGHLWQQACGTVREGEKAAWQVPPAGPRNAGGGLMKLVS